jgi:hypothetical protein
MGDDARRFDSIERVVRDGRRKLDDVESTVLTRLATHTHPAAALPGDVTTLIGGQRYTTNGTLVTVTTTETTAMTSGGLVLQGSSLFVVRAWVKYDSSVTGDAPILRIRSTNATGTKWAERLCPKVGLANSSEEGFLEATYVTTTSAFVTFVLTAQRFSGTGNIRVYGDPNNAGFVAVYRVGASSALTAV